MSEASYRRVVLATLALWVNHPSLGENSTSSLPVTNDAYTNSKPAAARVPVLPPKTSKDCLVYRKSCVVHFQGCQVEGSKFKRYQASIKIKERREGS